MDSIEKIMWQRTASGSTIRSRGEPRGIVVPANSWQEVREYHLFEGVQGRHYHVLLRGIASPTRSRSGMNDCKPFSTPWMLSSAADLGRGKSAGENRIADAHELRILYNRRLQWLLANARVENTQLAQKHTTEIIYFDKINGLEDITSP